MEAEVSRSDNKKLSADVAGLQDAYWFCTSEHVPFQDELVTAFSNWDPLPQLVADYVESLDEEFKDKVVKAFAMRFAEPWITRRKPGGCTTRGRLWQRRLAHC